MTAQNGTEFLLKIENVGNTGVFTAVGGFIANSLTISNEEVDVTTKDSAGWKQLLAGAGIISVALSGNGLFQNDAVFGEVNGYVLARTHKAFQLIVPGLGTYEGTFQITSVEMSGENEQGITYSISLASSGPISFT